MDRQTLLAFIIIGIIMILWPYYSRLFLPEQPPPSPVTQKEIKVDSVFDTQSQVRSETPILKKSGSESPALHDLKKSEIMFPEKEIIVDTPFYKGVISSYGGTIKQWILKRYKYGNGEPVEIMRKTDASNMAFAIFQSTGDTLNTAHYNFEVTGTEKKADSSLRVSFGAAGSGELRFTLDLGQGRKLEKVMTFYQDKYVCDVLYRIYGLKSLSMNNEYLITWGSGLEPTEIDIENDLTYSKIYALLGTDLETYQTSEKVGKEIRYDGTTHWFGTRTKYFAAAIIPKSETGKGIILSGESSTIEGKVISRNYHGTLIMPLREDSLQENHFQLFLGPLEYNLITGFNVDLEKMMDFGWWWIRPIAKAIYHILMFLYAYIPNYGFVIIVFSVLLKVLFFPLTKASYKSMKEMQKLQPEIALLKEKYKDDPQKLQKATMRLYKEHRVNPLGGCLPLLLQMPVFFALYPVLYSTIEFRSAPFIWWIKDLSQPDTIMHLSYSLPFYGEKVNILPMIWVVSMLFQNIMTMKDPKQKMMVYFMPIIMLLFFNRLPSGLVLYWTVFNILSIVQQMSSQGKSGSESIPNMGI